MDLNELLLVLGRRKLMIALVAAAVVALAIAGLRFVTPVYEATSTLALTPSQVDENTIFYFGTMDVIVPIYADAAKSRTTQADAAEAFGDLADIRVQTFKGTPIIKIRARDADPDLAQKSAQAVSDALIARAVSGEIGVQALRVTQLDRPVLPTEPVFPNERLTLITAALLGLGLGVAAGLLRETLATEIETREELARVSGAPAFAEIPHESAVVRIESPTDLVQNERLRIVSEALRDLRTNLLFSDQTMRTVVITSPDGSHGKTTVSYGLAVTLARSGTRTLLVDGDLRRGRVASLLRLKRSVGLMEVLLGEVRIEDAIHETSMENLHVLVGGRRIGDPGEFLTAEFPEVLERLEELYETIVIDGTPVVPVSDARVMARYADAVVLVASAGVTRRQVRTAVERLSLISVPLTAVVLNKSRTPDGSDYYAVSEEPQPRPPKRRRRRSLGIARR